MKSTTSFTTNLTTNSAANSYTNSTADSITNSYTTSTRVWQNLFLKTDLMLANIKLLNPFMYFVLLLLLYY